MTREHLNHSRPAPATAGAMLRRWREVRGKPQLELAMDTGITQKHVSFVETGRSTPRRQMIVDIADALRIPLRERNAIFIAAGYAPIYQDDPLDRQSMEGIDRAVRRLLRQQDPFPAIVMDRYWNVIQTNEAAPRFFGQFTDLSLRPKPRNLLHLVFDPSGIRPHLMNWEETARSLLQRVSKEAVGQVIDNSTRILLNELMSYPAVPQQLDPEPDQGSLPMVPLTFRLGSDTLGLFSMITTVGTPQSVAAQEMRIEMMFPTDDLSEARYLKIMDMAS